MSYWSDHPEKLDEITTEYLPPPWKDQVLEGRLTLDEVPEKIRFKAADEAVADYWAEQAERAWELQKEAECED